MNQLFVKITKCFALVAFVFAISFSPSNFAASPLDINSATAEEFAAVMSGVGTKKAQAIIAYRDEHGPFQALDDLIFVKGIGPSLLEKNRALLSVGEGEPFETSETALN